MIISHRCGFVFLHNPKVGGTSVRAAIEHLHDDPRIFWGSEPIGGKKVDLAHLGADEVARFFPELWDRIQGYRLFALHRDPLGRFYSSVAEYSKLHGTVDTRFAGESARLSALLELVETLRDHGTAEGLLEYHQYRHFRPQWIYFRPEIAKVTSYPIERIDAFLAQISALSKEPIEKVTRNAQDRLQLPGPLAALAASRRTKSVLKGVPGADLLKTALRRLFPASDNKFRLSSDDERKVSLFVQDFYARDYMYLLEQKSAR